MKLGNFLDLALDMTSFQLAAQFGTALSIRGMYRQCLTDDGGADSDFAEALWVARDGINLLEFIGEKTPDAVFLASSEVSCKLAPALSCKQSDGSARSAELLSSLMALLILQWLQPTTSV